MTETSADIMTEIEGLKRDQVEAVLKTAGDDMIWNSMEALKSTGEGTAAGLEEEAEDRIKIPKPKLVDPNDPHVIEIGKFAVRKHNEKAGTNLVFVKVIAGVKWNVVAATFYALMIAAKDSKGTHRGKALVVEAITGHKKLIWWKN